MGSDLYMEAQNYRPRQTIVFLNGEGVYEIYKDSFYSGYNLSFTAENTDMSRKWFTNLGYKIVDSRPGGPFGRHEKH